MTITRKRSEGSLQKKHDGSSGQTAGTLRSPGLKGSMFALVDDVVISGMSCRLPQCDNMEEFKQNLFMGKDMTTVDKEGGSDGMAYRQGRLKDLSKFDATFFGVPPKQANVMDPQLRMLLEVTYEAFMDAGVDPQSLRGSKTGVFIGLGISDTHEGWSTDPENPQGYAAWGCTKSMFANRISYAFNLRGPSYGMQGADAASALALDHALQSIRLGNCTAAVVGGVNLNLKQMSDIQYLRMGYLLSDGACRPFDEEASGYCRSDGVVVVFLQRSSVAKRCYATLVHSKQQCVKPKGTGLRYPSSEDQSAFLYEMYEEAGVDTTELEYVEAHGTGNRTADAQEVNAFWDALCRNREYPLLIGSVKSNLGHLEAAAGLASVAKTIVAMETGMIPANLHYRRPNKHITGLHDGNIEVVTEGRRHFGQYCGVNTLGFGGTHVHVILQPNNKKPKLHKSSDMTRLLLHSSNTAEGLRTVLNYAQEHSRNFELHALLNETAHISPNVHQYRGFTVLNGKEKIVDIQKCPEGCSGRPVWYIFSGMGTQWHGMGRKMMVLSTFHQSIAESDAALKAHGISVCDIIVSKDTDIFKSTLNSFVAIAAIQIALVKLLTEMGIHPDGIVGHSVGEIACAYADGCMTATEAVLSAYWRGKCVQEAKLPPGAMAAVGLTWKEAAEQCPANVIPACHNSERTVTISGPVEDVQKFIKDLQGRQVFVREVQSSGVAFHSPHMNKVAPTLKKALAKIVHPKPRTKRWISSSIPESHWDTDLAKTCSADYLVNNLVSPVLFQEALRYVTPNALVIEIGPHCLLQALLKRSLAKDCFFTGLMKKDNPDNVDFFFSCLGKCYINGLNLNPLGIYPPVEFPVPRGTPMISSLIRWDHSQSWDVPEPDNFLSGGHGKQAESTFEFDVTPPDGKDCYLRGHKIDGRVLFPAAGYLVLAWRALAKFKGAMFEHMPVTLENVGIHRATILPPTGLLKFEVSFIPATGEFEILEGEDMVASGRVFSPSSLQMMNLDCHDDLIPPSTPLSPSRKLEIPLTAADIYKEFRVRGYDYGKSFQGILSTDNRGEEGELLWNGRWISFIDIMMQMSLLVRPGRHLLLPTHVQTLSINPTMLHQKLRTAGKITEMAVAVRSNKFTDTVYADGIELSGLHITLAPRHIQKNIVVEEAHFVPYDEVVQVDTGTYSVKHYAEQCAAYAIKGLRKFSSKLDALALGPVKMDLVRKILKKDGEILEEASVERYMKTPNCGLMRMLHTVFTLPVGENFLENVANLYDAFKTELRTDMLLTHIYQAQALKPCLDIVVENISGSNISVMEMSGADDMLHERIQSLTVGHPGVTVDVTKVSCNPGVQEKAEDAGVVKWNLVDPAPEEIRTFHLCILDNVLHGQADIIGTLLNIMPSLHEDGFLLVREPTDNMEITFSFEGLISEWSNIMDTGSRDFGKYCSKEIWGKLFKEAGLEVVSTKSDQCLSTWFLLKKLKTLDPEKQTIVDVSHLDCKWLENLKQKLEECQKLPSGENLWLVSQGEAFNGLVGMIKCLQKEPGGKKLRCILNLDKKESLEELCQTSVVFQQCLKKNLLMNVYKDAAWGSFRHLPINLDISVEKRDMSSAHLTIQKRGKLSSLQWVESPLKYPQPQEEDKILCQVHYAAVNRRDILVATDKLNPDVIPQFLAERDCLLGMEFSGTDPDGKRIMGIVPCCGIATMVSVDKKTIWHVPDKWTLEEAVTVPLAYTKAYYTLVTCGQIQKGRSILIHRGDQDVGQAAIRIAQDYGGRVYTTVPNTTAKDFLMSLFPKLNNRNVFMLSDGPFDLELLRNTKGKGVSTVMICPVDEEHLVKSLNVVSHGGCVLDLARKELAQNHLLSSEFLQKDIKFKGVHLDALDDAEKTEVAQLLKAGIQKNVVKPIKAKVFHIDESKEAFEYLSKQERMEKVLIKVKEDSTNVPITVTALPQALCDSRKSYIITGGLGGFGLELAQWLIHRGASKLVLTSRSGVKTGYQSRKLRLWKDAKVSVSVSKRNVATLEETKTLIEEAQKLGPVGGIFHLAMVLKDGFIEGQTLESFSKVCEPKVQGTCNLDNITRNVCKETLDWFVVFSSISCGRGNAGQSNYGFANSVMERICEQRKKDNLPGLAIQWGAVGDVGIVLEALGDNETVVGGTLPQRLNSCLSLLDKFLCQENAVVTSFVPAETESEAAASDRADFGTKSPLDHVCHIIGVKDKDKLKSESHLVDLGLDSLMVTEIKQALEADHGLTFSSDAVRQLTVKELRELSKGFEKADAKTEKVTATQTETAAEKTDMSDVIPTRCVVKMNTVDNSKPPMFLVHGLEGDTRELTDLAAQINCPVYGVQCTQDAPLMSVSTLAGFYLQQINIVYPSGPMNLGGYKSGAPVAMEMALQLQCYYDDRVSDVLTSVLCLEGSNTYIPTRGQRFLQHTKFHGMTETEREADALANFVAKYVQEDQTPHLMEALLSKTNLKSMMSVSLATIRNNTSLATEHLEHSMVSYVQRYLITGQYKPEGKYAGPVTLIRGRQLAKDIKVAGDYNLGQICEGDVAVHILNSPHDGFLAEMADGIASTINAMVDAKVKERTD